MANSPIQTLQQLLTDLTPVELVGGMYLKREDKFTPYGTGGINGTKVRQCVYSIDSYARRTGTNRKGLISGASVKSSQLAVGTIVASAYNMPSVHVIGATTPTTAIRNEQVKIAHHFGAKFVINKLPYNPALQKKVDELLAGPLAGWYKLEYGSAIDHKKHSPQEVADFHGVGAGQVQNIPDSVDTLLVPTGSCNTLVSVLYGIAKYQKPISKVICLQIGPDKFEQTQEKLYCIEKATGLEIKNIPREYRLLNKRWSYQDDVHYNFHGIDMHPTYEGKCFQYLEENQNLINEHTCFWVTGSKPFLSNMVANVPNYTSINLW